jgi:hypothetical protein
MRNLAACLLIFSTIVTSALNSDEIAAEPKLRTDVPRQSAIPSAQEKKMNEFELTPTKDPAEALRRLLRLIDSLHNPLDLRERQVKYFTGLPTLDPSDKINVFYQRNSHQINEFWLYKIRVGGEVNQPKLRFAFEKAEKYRDQRPSMASICQLDMNQFHNSLLKIGFRHYNNDRGDGLVREYQRGLLSVVVSYYGESGESLEKINHKCIHAVEVTFWEKYIDFGELK